MATSIKISQLPAKGSNLEATDLLEVSEFNGTGYVTKSITGAEIVASVPPTSVEWGDIGGTLSSQTDLNTALSGKVPTTRTLTINGTTQDLSADRTFTISTGIKIGTTAITSGTVGRVLFEGTGNVVQESAGLTYNDTTKVFQISGNQNATTKINVSNTTAGITSTAEYNLTSDTTAGIFNFGKASSTYSPYKIFTASNGFIYNGTAGDIAILNDVASGRIKFSAGASTTAQMTIFNTGNVGINTTTDAGYKLDVNGTARVQGNFSALTSTSNGIVLTTGVSIEFWQAVKRAEIYREANNGFSFACGGVFSAHIVTEGALFGGTSRTDLNASAQLQANSTTKGFLPPRMTTTQKNAIASPATGLMVYDTTLNLMALYNGTTWTTL